MIEIKTICGLILIFYGLRKFPEIEIVALAMGLVLAIVGNHLIH